MIDDWNCREEYLTQKKVIELAWSPSGDQLAVSTICLDIEQTVCNAQVEIYDGATGHKLHLFKQDRMVAGLEWHPYNGELFGSDFQGVIYRWNTISGELIKKQHISDWAILKLSWNSAATQLFAGGYDNVLYILDDSLQVIQSKVLGIPLMPGSNGGIFWISCHPSRQQFATGSGQGVITIWDAQTLEVDQTLKMQGTGATVGSWNTPGNRIVCTGTQEERNIAHIWNVESGKPVTKLKGHTGAVTSISWNPKGEQVASTSYDGTVRIWNANNGRCLQIIRSDRFRQIERVRWASSKKLAYGGTVSLGSIGSAHNLDEPVFEILTL